MARHLRRVAMAWLFLSLVTPVWGEQYFLYSPRPITPEETKDTKDGVLVREVKVRQGDTLYRISRNNSGHGMYYPQIILFNDIKNPNLIYAGDILKVPVAKGQPAGEEATAAPVHRKKKGHKAGRKHKALSAVRPGKHPVAAKSAAGRSPEQGPGELKPSAGGRKRHAGSERGGKPVGAPRQGQGSAGTEAAAGQRLFEQAIKAYRQDDCRKALELFDRFLASYPTLPQAADASLYKADCYLKLSAQ